VLGVGVKGAADRIVGAVQLKGGDAILRCLERLHDIGPNVITGIARDTGRFGEEEVVLRAASVVLDLDGIGRMGRHLGGFAKTTA